MKILIEAGADVNTRNNQGDTPLHIACQNKLFGFVPMLLNAGANPNMINQVNMFPKDYAKKHENTAYILQLFSICSKNSQEMVKNENDIL